jgi:large subunit ribosomal protein L6
MSRLGKLTIKLPAGTEAQMSDGFIMVKGPKGQLKQALIENIVINISAGEISVTVNNPEDRKQKAIWGLYRSLINNMVIGVNDGFEKKLEIIGVGYKAAAAGNKVNISVGFSHPVVYDLPEGITAKTADNTILISGIDKQLVGEVAAQIRRIKKPEPYKGKGIKYADEVIRRKEGKAAVKGG